VLIDIDHFKAINDRFGHAVGDVALKHVSALLHGSLRDVDRLARFGGEEFLVLLPDTLPAAALELAERLRHKLESLPMQWQGQSVPLTASIGVTQWRGHDDPVDALLVRADTALYRAKHAGRNRVVAAESVRP
jgi:diguanylate cyclase (GGDEF)-like protein